MTGGSDSVETLDTLKKMAVDRDPDVREKAALGLRHLGGSDALDASHGRIPEN